MSDEGQKAIEIAAEATWLPQFDEKEAKAVIRAYLAELPGWRLVPSGLVRDTRFHLAPPPPGLED